MSNPHVAPSRTRAEVVELLQAHDITPTQQRVEIAAILLGRPQHLSAEQLLNLANEGQVIVSKATVYNTLGLLVRSGLVREVIVDPSKVFYDSNTDDHHHFYDVDTGALTDIERDDVAIDRLPALPAGTVVDGVDVIVRVRRAVPQQT